MSPMRTSWEECQNCTQQSLQVNINAAMLQQHRQIRRHICHVSLALRLEDDNAAAVGSCPAKKRFHEWCSQVYGVTPCSQFHVSAFFGRGIAFAATLTASIFRSCRSQLPTMQNQHKNQQRHLRHDRGSFLHGGIVIDRWNLFLVNSRMNMVPCLNYEILRNAKQQCLNRAQQKVLLSNFRRRERIIIFTLLARAGFSQRLSWVCLARIKWCTK